jgi:hypothetical protein
MITMQAIRNFGRSTRLLRSRRDRCACPTAGSNTSMPIATHQASFGPTDHFYNEPSGQRSPYPPDIAQKVGGFNPHRPHWAA